MSGRIRTWFVGCFDEMLTGERLAVGVLGMWWKSRVHIGAKKVHYNLQEKMFKFLISW